MPVALFMNLDAMMMSSRIEQVADDVLVLDHFGAAPASA